MKDTTHEWTDMLSEFLDGSLPQQKHLAVAEHLEACGECRGVLEELRSLVARAGALPPVTPPRDLWPGIAAALEAPLGAGETQVIALPSADWVERERHRRSLSFSFPQLAAAAVALMLISASLTYAVGPGVAVRDSGSPLGNGSVISANAPDLPGPPEGLSNELAALEGTLMEAGASLDEETILVLRNNLDVIERAIDDSRRALAKDPSNDFLMEHLERAYQRKLELLRQAAQIASWVS